MLTGATERSNYHRWLDRLPVRARRTWRSRGPKEEMGVRSVGERSSSYSFLCRSLLGFYEAKIMKLHFVHCVAYPLFSCPLTRSLPSVRFPSLFLLSTIIRAAWFRHDDKHHRFSQGFSVRSESRGKKVRYCI